MFLYYDSIVQIIQRGIVRILVNNILERVWKEVSVTQFELIFRISLEGLRHSTKTLNQGIRTEI